MLASFDVESAGVVSLVFGIVSIVASLLSCITICSKKGECNLLKTYLGIFYILVGLACIIAGIVYIVNYAELDSASAAKDHCGSYERATYFWLLGLQFRHALNQQAINNTQVTSDANNSLTSKLSTDLSFTSDNVA